MKFVANHKDINELIYYYSCFDIRLYTIHINLTILVQAKKQLSTTKAILRIHYVVQNKIVKKTISRK